MSALHFAMAAGALTGLILIAVAAVAVLLAIAQAVLPEQGGGGIEALMEATREEHPQYADWDVRELAP